MLVDVFILDFQADVPLRAAMSEICQIRWHMEPGCELFTFRSRSERFHIEGKRKAETISSSPIYVLADNDCLILGEKFVERGVEIIERHPQYGLLAATSICDGHFANGSDRQVLEEVVPMHAVGGVAFVRKGILTDFLPCLPSQVDETICHEMASKGYQTGSLPGLRFNHLGAGYSLGSPASWMTVPT